jgi:tRNA threonylcarbamoyl adenosine modification protein YeaZ
MPRDVLLALDTATTRGVIGLRSIPFLGSTRSPSIDLAKVYDGDADHAEKMLPELDALLSSSGLDRSSLGAVVVDVGPGSFTGVRVGVSCAKGLALGLRLPVVTVTSLEAIAESAFRSSSDRTTHLCVPVLDARRSEYFVALLRGDGAVISSPAVVKPDAVESWIGEAIDLAVREGRLDGSIRRESIEVLPLGTLPDPRSLLDLGERRLAAGSVVDAASFEPAYVRAPDATPMRVIPQSPSLPRA